MASEKNISSELKNSGVEKNVKVVPRKEHVYRVSEIEGTEQLTGEIRSAAFAAPIFEVFTGYRRFGHPQTFSSEMDRDSAGRRIAGVDLEEVITNKVKSTAIERKKAAVEPFSSRKKRPRNLLHYMNRDVCKIKSLSYDQLDQHTLGQDESGGN